MLRCGSAKELSVEPKALALGRRQGHVNYTNSSTGGGMEYTAIRPVCEA